MKFKSLQDLGVLKNNLLEKQAIDPLEERVQNYLKEEGLDEFEEISAREIAFELHDRGYANLDEVHECFNVGPLDRAKREIIFYVRSFQSHLEGNNFPINASLGLILVGHWLYKEIKAGEGSFCEKIEGESHRRKEEIDKLDSRINEMGNTVKGRAYFVLEGFKRKNKPLRIFADAVNDSFLFREFSEQYKDAKRQKLDAEIKLNERESVSRKTLGDYFHPLRMNLAYIINDVIRRISTTEISTTESGHFKDSGIMDLLGKRGIELRRDVLGITKDIRAISYFSSDIYRYTLSLNDSDPEKLSLLEEGLGHIREYMSLEPESDQRFKVGCYLQDLFVVKYIQKNEVDL